MSTKVGSDPPTSEVAPTLNAFQAAEWLRMIPKAKKIARRHKRVVHRRQVVCRVSRMRPVRTSRKSTVPAAASTSRGDPSSSSSDGSPQAPGQGQERLEDLIYRVLAEVELDRAERREARNLQRELLDELQVHGARMAAQAWRERQAA